VGESRAQFRVLAADRGAVRLLTLDRPDKLNAFTPDGFRLLAEALEAAAADPGVAVCVLTGNGRAFSAGVDLSVMGRPGGSTELGRWFDPLMTTLARFPKPLLAAVNGLAVGFGSTLLLHCDLVIADADAQFRLPFVALGTSAEAASSWLLPRRVGMQQATWMILSGAPFGAEEAVATGFALAQAPAGRAVEEALGRAERLAVHRVPALVLNKRLLRHGWADQVADVWQREKAAMLAIADEVGPIGWSGDGGD
jgi:enoyl-CoA hydratase/carnithine racemase